MYCWGTEEKFLIAKVLQSVIFREGSFVGRSEYPKAMLLKLM